MKITFLGTSHGVPDAERYCQSILVEANDSAYLIDAGAPVMDLLLRKNFDLKKIKAVFTTHMHGDHLDGLLEFVDLCTWYFKETNFDIYMTEKSGIDAFEMLLDAYGGSRKAAEDRIRFKPVDKNTVYDDGCVRVTTHPTDHMALAGRPSFGYLIEAEGKKVYISGDMSEALEDYPSFVNDGEIDVFIVESAHFMPDKLVEKLKDCKAKQVMIIHGYRPEIADEIDSFAHISSFELICPSDNDEYIV